MAGPRVAPRGSLRKIADSTGSKKTGLFAATKPSAPKIRPNTFTGDESDSGSSSSSDDDSGSDNDSQSEAITDLQKRLSQTPSKKAKPSGSKSKTESKLSTPAKSPATVNGLTTSVKKESSLREIKKENSSEDSGDSSKDEKDKPAQTHSQGKKKAVKAESSSSDSDSDTSSSSESQGEDEQDSDEAAKQVEEQLRNEANSANASSAASQASEKPSKKAKTSKAPVSDDEDSDENEDSDEEMVDQSTALTNGGSPTKVGSVPEFIAPDFHLRKLEGVPDAAKIAKFFSQAQLDGKQVWYITTPASLPVTLVHDLTIPMEDAEKGKPVLTHNGEDYRMAFDNPSASSAFRLLVPDKKGGEYSLLNRPVNQSMHITRSETFGPGGASSVTTTQTVVTTKPARPQPEGLRARYTPLGVASPKPTFTIPPPTQKAATSVTAAPRVPEASLKKKRKNRDDGEDGPIAAVTFTTPNRKDTPSGKKNPTAEKSAKKQKTRNEPDLPSVPKQQTPVPVPVPAQINGTYRSGSVASATQPAPRSRSSASPGAGLPATQVKVRQSPVPLPAILRTTSSGQLGTPRPSLAEDKKPEQPAMKVKKEKKEKKSQAKKADAIPAAAQTPRKVTQILPPKFDSRGRRIS